MSDADNIFFQAALENCPFVFFQADNELNCFYVNDRFCKMTGLTQEEARGHGWFDAIHTEDVRRVDAFRGNELATVGASITTRLVHKDGGVRWMSGWIVPVKREDGVQVGLCGTMHDVTDEKLAQRQLREREQLLAGVFGNEHTVMMIGDPETGEILDANPAAQGFYGYSAEEFRRMWIWDLTSVGRGATLESLARMVAGVSRTYRSRHRMRDGSLRDVEVNAAPVSSEGRKLLFVVVHDVSERSRVREALRESEERFRGIVEASPDGVFVEVDGKFAYVNPAAVALFGARDAGELLGREVSERVHEEWRDYVRERLELVREHGRTPLAAGRYLRLDGTDIRVETTSRLIEYRNEHGALVLLRDVSERERAEEKALWAAAVIEGANLAVVGIGCDGTIISWNPEAERLFGHTAEQAVGRSLRDHGVVPEAVCDQLTAEDRRDAIEPLSMRLKATDGREIEAMADISVVRGSDGDVRGMSAIIRDVSAENQLERAKDELLAIASHELRTPLTTILGYANLLEREDLDDDSRRLRYAARIREQAERMRGQIEEMLQMVLVESASSEIELGWVDMEALANTVVDGLPLADRERVVIESDSFDVCCDASRLAMALSNLMGNALKFSDGEVRVLVERDEAETRVAVSDHGAGIEPADQERVFERFYQADMSSTRGFGGFGLGLYITRLIVESHGGTVDVESVPGEGSTFRIRLPHRDGEDAGWLEAASG